MENKEITLRKIPLKVLIEILQDVWDHGADYVDIIGVPDAIQDNICVAVKEEYMIDSQEEENSSPENKEITDEDLNQLI
jgi:hypothetical protein